MVTGPCPRRKVRVITGSFYVLKIKIPGKNVSNNKLSLPSNTKGEGNFYNFHVGPTFIEATTISHSFFLFSFSFFSFLNCFTEYQLLL